MSSVLVNDVEVRVGDVLLLDFHDYGEDNREVCICEVTEIDPVDNICPFEFRSLCGKHKDLWFDVDEDRIISMEIV